MLAKVEACSGSNFPYRCAGCGSYKIEPPANSTSSFESLASSFPLLTAYFAAHGIIRPEKMTAACSKYDKRATLD